MCDRVDFIRLPADEHLNIQFLFSLSLYTTPPQHNRKQFCYKNPCTWYGAHV